MKGIVPAMFFWKFRPRRKAKVKSVDKKELEAIYQGLETRITREDLQEYLDKIEKDKNRKRVWAGLSTHKKIKVLRYAVERKKANGR